MRRIRSLQSKEGPSLQGCVFNQTILYGKDTTIEQIVDAAKRFPMMAEHQLVIVREAQELSRVIHQLESYVANPQPSTILVVCYKYKSLDKRKKLYKSLQGQSVLFESKKLYENQVPDWIQRPIRSSTTPTAAPPCSSVPAGDWLYQTYSPTTPTATTQVATTTTTSATCHPNLRRHRHLP